MKSTKIHIGMHFECKGLNTLRIFSSILTHARPESLGLRLLSALYASYKLCRSAISQESFEVSKFGRIVDATRSADEATASFKAALSF